MPLRRLNPLVKLAVAVIWIAVVTVVFDPRVMAAAALAPVLALLVLDRAPPVLLLKVTIPFALIGFGYLWVNLLFHRQSGGYAQAVADTTLLADPAAEAGVTLFFRALAFGFISFAFVRTTAPVDLVRALMQQARLPATLGFSLFAGVQQLPYLHHDLRQMRLARAMRSGRPPRRVPGPREMAGLTIGLLADALRRAERVAIGMEVRGLRPGLVRTSLHRSRLSWRDAVFAAAALLVLAAVVSMGA